jgi:predicted secreted protein
MKRFIIAITSLATALMPLAGIRAATISPGDLIKASGPAIYYYHSDGTRLVFPNEKTYFTWYDDFSGVKTITDEELAVITIGGNVTYRPGVRMIKITTDPKVYAIGENRELRWVGSEELAVELYGEDWATMIDDIPDAFFVDYESGSLIAAADDYKPSELTDANPTIADTVEPSTKIITGSIEKTVGEIFTITLDSNATTGYSWEAGYDESFLELVSSTYISPNTDLVGAGGSEEFVFKTLLQGTTELTMNYRRSWEEGVDPIERRIYSITILPIEPDVSVTITPNKTEAQKNEVIDLLAESNYIGMIDRLDILVNGELYKSCTGSSSCATNWTVPSVDTISVYTITARLTALDNGIYEATADITIVSQQTHSSINVILERETVKPTQTAAIKIQIEAGLNARKIEIYIDGEAKKVCVSTLTVCRYDDYIQGDLGTTHEVYARVETPAYLWYQSESKTITIAENDSPRITVAVGQAEILPTVTIDITVTANDDDGISYTELIKDGVVLKHCIGATPCTVIVGPYDLPSGSVVTFDAKAEDLTGLARTITAAASITIR